MPFIAHDFGVVAEIAHRFMVMQHGAIVGQGATAEVFTRPRHACMRALLDSIPGRPRLPPDHGAPPPPD